LLIEDIPYHLRNTITELVAPVYIELGPGHCHPPSKMALGDTLMMLGLIRNQGRRLRLLMDPGPWRPLVESHPLVAEVVTPPGEPQHLGWYTVPVAMHGRDQAFWAKEHFTFGVPVLPVDQIRANPVAAHSAYYNLANTSDRPEVFVDPDRPLALAGLLSRQRPTLVVYPENPGRADPYWRDLEWWRRLLTRLKQSFALVAVGADDYGPLTPLLDAVLARSDPASRLTDLAALLRAAAGFVGRDGGIMHLAAAVNRQTVMIWDSMSSYRLWANATACHVVFSNPYILRYPQANRILEEDYAQMMTRISSAELGIEPGSLSAQEALGILTRIFGSETDVRRNLRSIREKSAEEQSVASWSGQPQLKERFHQETLDFTCRALQGATAPGSAWVAPVFP
jgi:hypothetical protein